MRMNHTPDPLDPRHDRQLDRETEDLMELSLEEDGPTDLQALAD